MSVNQVNQTTGALSPIAGGTLYADAPVGSIQAYGGATAPFGWLLCQGQAVSRATYAELFGVIGTSFGSGDGSTTFNIPDLRGEFLRGAGTNSHSGQGSGGTVGEHQDATQIAPSLANSTIIDAYDITGNGAGFKNSDTGFTSGSISKYTRTTGTNYTGGVVYIASTRPTNTSVNFIIKATTIALPSDFEDVVDKKIKDKTNCSDVTVLGTITSTATGTSVIFSQSLSNFNYLIIRVAAGYTSITNIIPTTLLANGTQTFTVTHGRPAGGYGGEGLIDITQTAAVLHENYKIVGWSFGRIEFIGAK